MDKNWRRGRPWPAARQSPSSWRRDLFLSPAKSYAQAEEALITLMMEMVLDKERILGYLNVIEWGSGVFGAEAAAQRYFKESAAQLSAEQAAEARRDGAQPAVLRAQPQRARAAEESASSTSG
jgi:monofunctional biosynthetic peptidoglycan transglycosylase